jgi:hypothetical protein
MGNAKSLNRADLERAAEKHSWAFDVETLSRIHDELSNKRRSSSKNGKKTKLGPLHHDDIDDIYELVLSLKKEGKEGKKLLQMFVEAQADLLQELHQEEEPLPIKSITINTAPTTKVMSNRRSTRSPAA